MNPLIPAAIASMAHRYDPYATVPRHYSPPNLGRKVRKKRSRRKMARQSRLINRS